MTAEECEAMCFKADVDIAMHEAAVRELRKQREMWWQRMMQAGVSQPNRNG